MTIFKQELRSQKLALLLWGLGIGLMVAVCVFMYPQMAKEMGSVNAIFSSMGAFTKAFGMDKLNFGTLMGFYGIEGGNVIGIGGAFFAAIYGVNALMKEEKDRTAEFLLTHPVSRARVVTEKLLSVFVLILVMNLIVLVCSLGSVVLIGEQVEVNKILLLHLAYLLMQFEIAGICFGVSAFVVRSGMGIAIGVATVMYMLNILANISSSAKALKYITAFGYTEASDIIGEGRMSLGYLGTGMLFMVIGIVAAYGKYTSKDIH